MTQPKAQRRRRLLRNAALTLCLVVVAVLARPSWHLVSTAWSDSDERVPLPVGEIDDASELNRSEILGLWPVPEEGAEEQLAQLLDRARRENIPVSIAGARHSMGGHSIAAGGIVLDMRPFDAMTLDEASGILEVECGALWSEVVPFLDARGYSVGVLQSNNSFSVGGSISVNCHGWAYGRPPICSTVESFRIMLADGSVKRCTREEDAELFGLALGGYGYLGSSSTPDSAWCATSATGSNSPSSRRPKRCVTLIAAYVVRATSPCSTHG